MAQKGRLMNIPGRSFETEVVSIISVLSPGSNLSRIPLSSLLIVVYTVGGRIKEGQIRRRILSYTGLFLLISVLIGIILVERLLTARIIEYRDAIADLNVRYVRYLQCSGSGLDDCLTSQRDFMESYGFAYSLGFFQTIAGYDESFAGLVETVFPGPEPDPADLKDNAAYAAALIELTSRAREYGDEQFASIRVLTDASVVIVLAMFIVLFALYTQNRRIVDTLERTLREKEFLIKEVHHRVKNNLNMVKGLISIKAVEIGTPDLFADIESHVQAISRLHERMYRGENAEMIEVSGYLSDLVAGMFHAVGERRVETHLDMQPLTVDPDIAISLGLILNEASTNAVKHGFPGEAAPRFDVELRPDGGDGGLWVLEMRNTGTPFPPDVSAEHPPGLGLRLMKSLAAQIGGDMSIGTGSPTAVRVTFSPLPR
jgi:two-component sensor histidine kinase